MHDSLLPSGEPSSFFGFGDDDDEYEDDDEDMDDNDANGSEAGRVRSDFHSGGGPGARYAPY
jgi:nucleotide-sensitive chloride channel 1A